VGAPTHGVFSIVDEEGELFSQKPLEQTVQNTCKSLQFTFAQQQTHTTTPTRSLSLLCGALPPNATVSALGGKTVQFANKPISEQEFSLSFLFVGKRFPLLHLNY